MIKIENIRLFNGSFKQASRGGLTHRTEAEFCFKVRFSYRAGEMPAFLKVLKDAIKATNENRHEFYSGYELVGDRQEILDYIDGLDYSQVPAASVEAVRGFYSNLKAVAEGEGLFVINNSNLPDMMPVLQELVDNKLV